MSQHKIKSSDIYFREMIFEQPFDTIYGDNFFFLSFHWLKTMEREKGKERIKR